MLEKLNESHLHIFIGVLLLVAGLLLAPQSVPHVKAQGGSCGSLCGVGYGACGPAPAGYTISCVQSRNTTINRCVCTAIPGKNPDDTTVPNPSKSPDDSTVPAPSGTLPQECANRCDLNKDGLVNKADFRDIDPNDPASADLIKFCSQSCPWVESIPSQPQPSPNPSGLIGDCSGAQAGIPDGKVNVQDIEYYRQELNDEVQTRACDFDSSGDVDIIDFTNYLRSGFIEYNRGGDDGSAPSGSVSPVPSVSTNQ